MEKPVRSISGTLLFIAAIEALFLLLTAAVGLAIFWQSAQRFETEVEGRRAQQRAILGLQVDF